MKKFLLKIATLILVSVLALSAVGCNLFIVNENNVTNTPGAGGSNNPPVVDTLVDSKFGTIDNSARSLKSRIELFNMVKDSVVAINVESSSSVSSGSGVIVDLNLTDKEGNVLDKVNEFYIITCHHVIEGMGEITVFVPDAESDNWGDSDYDVENYAFTGTIDDKMHPTNAITLVGGDLKSDIAVLKMTIADSEVASTITKAKFPSISDYTMVEGEDVVSIGNPGTSPNHKEQGFISYLFREIQLDGIGDLTVIEHTADIDHGSSGGGLFNFYGELIGITNAGSDTYVMLNYAIPYAVDVSSGTADFGFMNIASILLQTKTDTNYGYVPNRVKMFGMTTSQKVNSTVVTISSVTEGSLAYGKLQKDDIILKVVKGSEQDLNNASQITGSDDVSSVFKSLNVGDTIWLYVNRPGRGYLTVSMTAQQYRFCDTGN